MNIKRIAFLIAVFFMIMTGTGLSFGDDSGYSNEDSAQAAQSQPEYVRGTILRVFSDQEKNYIYSGGSIETNLQIIEVRILQGTHKGEVVLAEYQYNLDISDQYQLIKLSPGDEVLLFLDENETGRVENAYVIEIARDKYLLYLVIAFFIILILVGRMKGLKAIVSLVLTVLAVLYVLLPAILKGMDPVLVSTGICIVVISITLFIISGFTRKSFSAIIGTTGGVIAAGVIAIIVGTLAKLTGLGDEDSQMLMFIPQNIHFDFRGLLFSGIIIGAMGATMDVGMSIASAMHEVRANSPDISRGNLIRAGMNVGRDAMATMANTLILAYAGGSLHLMLLFMAYGTPFSEIINWDMIASEVLRAIAGSIGIVFTIPITALASGLIEFRKLKS